MPPLPVESAPSPNHDLPRSALTSAVGTSKGGEGMRRGLELYKERYPDVDAILIGTRRGDPHGGASPPLSAPYPRLTPNPSTNRRYETK
jgi:FAD synthetase